MKYICIYACLLAFCVALAAMWPQPMPHWNKARGYTVRHFCELHPDVCSKNRLAYHTPTPIPSHKGYVVVLP